MYSVRAPSTYSAELTRGFQNLYPIGRTMFSDRPTKPRQVRSSPHKALSTKRVGTRRTLLAFAALCWLAPLASTTAADDIKWSPGEKLLADELKGLRSLDDDVRAKATKGLALKIRGLPRGADKLRLASNLTSLSTEGDYGLDTLQAVATTLSDALREHPVPWTEPGAVGTAKFDDASLPPYAYRQLAQLVRYEGVRVSLAGTSTIRLRCPR
jgi:hypothetical protein